jgi:hypothetical protein
MLSILRAAMNSPAGLCWPGEGIELSGLLPQSIFVTPAHAFLPKAACKEAEDMNAMRLAPGGAGYAGNICRGAALCHGMGRGGWRRGPEPQI